MFVKYAYYIEGWERGPISLPDYRDYSIYFRIHSLYFQLQEPLSIFLGMPLFQARTLFGGFWYVHSVDSSVLWCVP